MDRNIKARFSVDRGGTFTDVYGELVEYNSTVGDGGRLVKRKVLKLLSEDPGNYNDAPREGIRRLMENFFEKACPRDEPLGTERIESIRMGTTVATNALLEHKGERFALITTKGFGDVWHIGNQARPDIFDLAIKCPKTLYDCVEELDERVVLASKDARERFQGQNLREATCVTGERVLVERPLDEGAAKHILEQVHSRGIKAVAIVFMHAALFPEHEQRVGAIARELGFEQVSLSHQVMQMVKLVPRGYTTSADAYLTPHIGRYLATFRSGFDSQLLDRVQVSFMQSDGGLTRVDRFTGNRAILSGPAGGVVGYALTSELAVQTASERSAQTRLEEVVGFDMGGTSTDVSRYAGHLEHVFETTTAGVTIQAPQLDISTVAAGGGSKLTFSKGLFQVGPESVGAHPGPVCYRKGGDLAVTDANVVLGRLLPEHFPKIFGPGEDEPLDTDGSRKAFLELAASINVAEGSAKTPEEIAFGFVTVANEAMSRPIRNLTQMRGFDLAKHTLACFGGAGGQHACAIARALGMSKVFVHRYSGILSAFGIGLADVVEDCQEPTAAELNAKGALLRSSDAAHLDQAFRRLKEKVLKGLVSQGFVSGDVSFEYFCNMRFKGTDTALMVRADRIDMPMSQYVEDFFAMYEREFGFLLSARDIVIDDIRVRGSGQSGARLRQNAEVEDQKKASSSSLDANSRRAPAPLEIRKVYFQAGWTDAAIHRIEDVSEAAPIGGTVQLDGPAILIDPNSTIVIEPLCVAFVSRAGDVTIDILNTASESQEQARDAKVNHKVAVRRDPIQLSLFSHRFMGIAEQMGRTLQRTSVSVNIKERLDFSCALFGPDGGLVANAPHIPVHLGAMQEAIRFQHARYFGPGRDPSESPLVEGDVLVSNHPQLAGGSHLPDITVITPCFEESGSKLPVFWVASRGHHADVGGITPGSMPPHSKALLDEGAAIVSFRLVRRGEFQEAGITKVLSTPSNPGDPMCTGTRALPDNLSDLRAQVAANTHGIRLLGSLVREHSLRVVQAYMKYIQDNAEEAVRDMLKSFAKARALPGDKSGDHVVVSAQDHMDDGTIIKVSIAVDPNTGSASFDFAGTGFQVAGNCNAPPAVTFSAIIYSLRCLVGQDIPLNEGCLAPIEIHIPKGCVLNPSQDAAVVGGNVLTSQRVVDVVLRAFEACAASQGCMNNLTFGDSGFGYYETIAGGAGAGPTWEGRSGIHTHMTNTRITDAEVLERRYPVLLREFSLRHGSGGAGMKRGGDGVVREIEFLRAVTVSLLTERRAFAPYGMHGGADAEPGVNLFKNAKDERLVNLGGKNTVHVLPGDTVRMLTPGGGGFGKPVQLQQANL